METPNTPDLAAFERIKSIERQIREIRMGFISSIRCPYCDSFNSEGDEMCCKRFMQAVAAIVDRLHRDECIETADKIAQKVN